MTVRMAKARTKMTEEIMASQMTASKMETDVQRMDPFHLSASQYTSPVVFTKGIVKLHVYLVVASLK